MAGRKDGRKAGDGVRVVWAGRHHADVLWDPVTKSLCWSSPGAGGGPAGYHGQLSAGAHYFASHPRYDIQTMQCTVCKCSVLFVAIRCNHINVPLRV